MLHGTDGSSHHSISGSFSVMFSSSGLKCSQYEIEPVFQNIVSCDPFVYILSLNTNRADTDTS